MRIAILGATSQIARDLVTSFLQHDHYELTLFGRKPEIIQNWLSVNKDIKSVNVNGYDQFTNFKKFDWIINFVGVGDPAKAITMGQSIFEITSEYDNLVIDYLKVNPNCRYIFLSSGAVYGSSFEKPANLHSKGQFTVNNIQPYEWYAVAKLHAEYRHRALVDLGIVDVRVFNYFSHTQNLEARFLLTDLLRSIREKTVFETSSENIVRDYLHPTDFYQLIKLLLCSSKLNFSLDCYSKLPIDKMNLLKEMRDKFGLRYLVSEINSQVNATGFKKFYFSENKIAETIGYKPKFTSLEGICVEVEKLFDFSGFNC